jgi:hypothetical protein
MSEVEQVVKTKVEKAEMTPSHRARIGEKKIALRKEVEADFKVRFPRLAGKRLRTLVNTKADMLLAEAERADALERKQAYLQEDEPAGIESSPFVEADGIGRF